MSNDEHFLNDPSFLNSLARHAGITQGSSVWANTSGPAPLPRKFTNRSAPEPFESEDLRRRSARDEAKKSIRKPSRGASLETALRQIISRASRRDDPVDPVDRLAAIETLSLEALRLYIGDDLAGPFHVSEPNVPTDPEDARDALRWRQACDEAYTDGVIARKCGIGQDDHGLRMDTDRSAALAQAFRLGWATADAEAVRDDVVEAARLVLKFGDADARDALRAALDRLSP